MIAPHVYAIEGIVLKRRSTAEADRVLTIFSRQRGKIRVLAKGVRKITSRRAGHIELFTRVQLLVHARQGIDSISEAQRVRAGITGSDIGSIAFAYCLCELIDQLLPDLQPHDDVYDLLCTSLEMLECAESIDARQRVLGQFVHELLIVLGFLPHGSKIEPDHMRPYIESITERKLRTWPMMSILTSSSA